MSAAKEAGKQISSLNKMSKRSVAIYHAYARSIGVSDSTLGILYALYEVDGPCSQYDLCNEWSLPKQTVNTAVSLLQKKGMVTISPVPGAKNKKSIVLTDLGRDFTRKTVKALREAELESLRALDPGERKAFVLLNQKYNEALAKNLEELLSGYDVSLPQSERDKGAC